MHLPWQGKPVSPSPACPLSRRSSLILLPFALLIGLAACGDAPLEPAAVPQTDGTPMTDALGGVSTDLQKGGQAVNTCFTSAATPNGPHAYRYGTITLDIPRGIVQAAGGETVRFNYRLWREDGSLVRLANCVIPRSQAALRWTAAWFRSAEAGNNIRWVNSSGEEVDDGSLGTMDEFDDGGSCVSDPHPDNPCHIDGVVVPPDDGGGGGDPDWGDDDDWGGDDPCWDCTGGGGGTDPGTGDDDCDPHAIDGGCEKDDDALFGEGHQLMISNGCNEIAQRFHEIWTGGRAWTTDQANTYINDEGETVLIVGHYDQANDEIGIFTGNVDYPRSHQEILGTIVHESMHANGMQHEDPDWDSTLAACSLM